MKIRRANTNDLNNLAELFNGYRTFYKQSSDRQACLEFLRHRFERDESVIFVAENEGNLLGFTQLFPSFSSVSMQRLWILNDLFVASAARKQGVAKALMNAARDFAIQTKSKGIILETDCDNVNAQKLYVQLGYQKQDSTYHYFLAVNSE